ncbi:MAG: Xaa-Pro aminopeptidase, partial [Sulfurimonas sp.]
MINEKEYQRRRELLTDKLAKNSLSIVFSSENKTRSNDTNYPYRQNSNFYYLTGFKEDNSCLLFVKGKQKTKCLLFVQKKDEVQELWNGKRLGNIEAKKRFLVDEVIIIDNLKETIKKVSKDTESLYYDFGNELSKVKKLFKDSFKKHRDISIIIGEMRLVKSESEIKLIKKAISITKKAHHKVMSHKKKGKNEYELLASIEYNFKKQGAYNDAYTSIVAGGDNANILHYISNDKPLIDGELILIDAGCEYDYYASDITRTIP